MFPVLPPSLEGLLEGLLSLSNCLGDQDTDMGLRVLKGGTGPWFEAPVTIVGSSFRDEVLRVDGLGVRSPVGVGRMERRSSV